jgi:hypothetical protein
MEVLKAKVDFKQPSSGSILLMFTAVAKLCLMDFNIYLIIKIKLAAHSGELFL